MANRPGPHQQRGPPRVAHVAVPAGVVYRDGIAPVNHQVIITTDRITVRDLDPITRRRRNGKQKHHIYQQFQRWAWREIPVPAWGQQEWGRIFTQQNYQWVGAAPLQPNVQPAAAGPAQPPPPAGPNQPAAPPAQPPAPVPTTPAPEVPAAREPVPQAASTSSGANQDVTMVDAASDTAADTSIATAPPIGQASATAQAADTRDATAPTSGQAGDTAQAAVTRDATAPTSGQASDTAQAAQAGHASVVGDETSPTATVQPPFLPTPSTGPAVDHHDMISEQAHAHSDLPSEDPLLDHGDPLSLGGDDLGVPDEEIEAQEGSQRGIRLHAPELRPTVASMRKAFQWIDDLRWATNYRGIPFETRLHEWAAFVVVARNSIRINDDDKPKWHERMDKALNCWTCLHFGPGALEVAQARDKRIVRRLLMSDQTPVDSNFQTMEFKKCFEGIDEIAGTVTLLYYGIDAFLTDLKILDEFRRMHRGPPHLRKTFYIVFYLDKMLDTRFAKPGGYTVPVSLDDLLDSVNPDPNGFIFYLRKRFDLLSACRRGVFGKVSKLDGTNLTSWMRTSYRNSEDGLEAINKIAKQRAREIPHVIWR